MLRWAAASLDNLAPYPALVSQQSLDSSKVTDLEDRLRATEIEIGVQMVEAARRAVAALFVRGAGLEVGAGSRPFPVPASAICFHGDIRNTVELSRYFDRDEVATDGVIDATSFSGVRDGSVDFVISAHVIEHLENPVASIENAVRVLKPGGIHLLVVPDMRHTFDAGRPETTLAHAMADYADGGAGTRLDAYREHIVYVHPRFQPALPADMVESEAQKISDANMDLHFHAWTRDGFETLLKAVGEWVPFDIVFSHSVLNENIFVLRKREAREKA